jgi:hypothetical protein
MKGTTGRVLDWVEESVRRLGTWVKWTTSQGTWMGLGMIGGRLKGIDHGSGSGGGGGTRAGLVRRGRRR